MQNITKITLAWELYETGMLKQDIAQRVAVNRDTIRLPEFRKLVPYT